MQVAVENEAARFNSDVAHARAQAKSAELQIQGDAVKNSLWNNAYNTLHTIRKDEIIAAKDEGQLAIESERNRIMAEANKAKQDKTETLLTDPADVKRDANGQVLSGGKYKWMLDTKLAGNEGVKKVGDASSSFDEIHQNIERLKEMSTKFQTKYGPTWYKRLSSEEYRNFDNRRGLLSASIQKSQTGLQANEKETELYLKQIQDPKLFERGGHGSDLDNVLDWARIKYDAVLNNTPGVRPLESSELGALEKAGHTHRPLVTSAPDAKAEVDARFEGKPPSNTALGAEVDAASEPEKSNEGVVRQTAALNHLWLAAVDPAMYRKISGNPEKYKPVAHGELPESDEQLRADALQALQSLANNNDTAAEMLNTIRSLTPAQRTAAVKKMINSGELLKPIIEEPLNQRNHKVSRYEEQQME